MVRARLTILTFLVAVPFCVALGRLAILQLVPSYHLEALRASRRLSISPLTPERGRILDRGGEVLAGNRPVYRIEFEYSKLNPRDRLVAILADELAEEFESFPDRERIEERILELARPQELATPPKLVESVPSAIKDRRGAASDEEWLYLIGSIHPDAKERIVHRWKKSLIPAAERSGFAFLASSKRPYLDLWFSRRRLVRQETVLLRLARLLAEGKGAARWQAEYDRLVGRVRSVRARFERFVERDVGPPPERDADSYGYWKRHADLTRTLYHRQASLLVRDVSLDVASTLEYYPASFPGLSTRSGSRRVYPEKEICGSFLGHLRLLNEHEEPKLRGESLLLMPYLRSQDDLEDFRRIRSDLRSRQDWIGATGLERYYDGDLRGLYGARVVRRVNRRGLVEVVDELPAEDGLDKTTTIDLLLQRLIYEELTRVSRGTSSDHGTAASAVVMDVSSGAVLACAGVPSIDPNRIREKAYHDELEARWGRQTKTYLWDRTRYPLVPGSVFKIVLAAAALETADETGFSLQETTYACNYKFPHFDIHCDAKYGHGLDRLNLVQALKFSCNNYFFSLGYDLLTSQRIDLWARRFGFGQSPGIDLPPSRGDDGFLPLEPDKVKNVDVCHLSIGQVHVKATPLQVARSLCLIAGGGQLPHPYLVEPTAVPETVTFENPHTLEIIDDGLWRVAHETGGTAARTGLGVFRVALKTGTAEVQISKEKLNNAWLVGYAPAGPGGERRARPRIAFAVVVEETRGHGARVCAPVVRSLLEYFASRDPDAYTLDRTAFRKTAGD